MAGNGESPGDFIGEEDASVRGVHVEGANSGDRSSKDVAAELVGAAQRLVDAGHTVLHFMDIEQPVAGMFSTPGGTRMTHLVVGQRALGSEGAPSGPA